jgi:hypothetical protein
MKNALVVGIAVLFFIVVGVMLASWRPTSANAPNWFSGPTIEHLESLSELVCLRVHISDILVGEDNDYRGSWLIKGDAMIGIDLRGAKITETDPTMRRAKIKLPAPRVASARIDHERTRTWSVEKTTWIPWVGDPDRIRDQAMRQAQRVIHKTAGSEENLQAAKKSAEKVIREIYRMVGWEVTVDWVVTQPAS